jgi:hypothetical protein
VIFFIAYRRGSRRHGKGAQEWRQRLKMMYAHWDSQMERLVDTYLEWKHGSRDLAPMEEDEHEFHVSVIGTFGTSFNIFRLKVT